MNAINIIAPYKYLGMWVFDDPRVGLVQEPFVAGADTMIDRVVENIPEAEKGFLMLFSTTPFPGHQVKLEWRRGDGGGNWYYAPQLNMEGWLCPALFLYFQQAPNTIYAKAEPLPAGVDPIWHIAADDPRARRFVSAEEPPVGRSRSSS